MSELLILVLQEEPRTGLDDRAYFRPLPQMWPAMRLSAAGWSCGRWWYLVRVEVGADDAFSYFFVFLPSASAWERIRR